MESTPLDLSFYERSDVVAIARELLGKIIISHHAPGPTIARIVEVEAYAGVGDKASHAFLGRRTPRNEAMYGPAGRSYVYLCYGIHHLLNLVTATTDVPHAVLIRALAPVAGADVMAARTGKAVTDATLGRGPGNACKALGITLADNGLSLHGPTLVVADDGFVVDRDDVVSSPRIGVDYAAEDALLPYRFFIRGHRHVSGRRLLR